VTRSTGKTTRLRLAMIQKTGNKRSHAKAETLARTNLELSNRIAELSVVEQTLRALNSLPSLVETAQDGIFFLMQRRAHHRSESLLN
jgi:hypothetical protein